MLISLEVAAEGAEGLGEGGRGPKVVLGVPAWAGHSHVCSLAKRTCSGLQPWPVSPSQEHLERSNPYCSSWCLWFPSIDGNDEVPLRWEEGKLC